METRNDRPDQPDANTSDPRYYAPEFPNGGDVGNHVIIDHGGEYSLLVHLRKGSVRVKVGDVVKCEIANLDTMDRRVTATMQVGAGGGGPNAHPSVAPAAPRGNTLGDLIKEKLGDKLDETLKR